MEILGIKWTPEQRNVADLKKWDKNPRMITEVAFERLKRKVLEEGMHQVLTIDTDNTVLSGNQRLQILTEVGVEQVWVMVPERKLTDEERDKVAFNRTSLREHGMPICWRRHSTYRCFWIRGSRNCSWA